MADLICPRCKEYPRETNGAFCAECRRTYQKKRYRGIHERLVARGRRVGIEDFRLIAVGRFQQIGRAEMNGLTAAEILRTMVVE